MRGRHGRRAVQAREAGSGGAKSRGERERPSTVCEFGLFRTACQFLHLSELVRSEFADQLGTLRPCLVPNSPNVNCSFWAKIKSPSLFG